MPSSLLLVCVDHDKSLVMLDTEELEALDPLHYSPVDVNRGLLGPPFPIVHDHLLLSC